MPVNNLFVVKEKYNFLNNTVIEVERPSYIKACQELTAFSEKNSLQNEAVIKKMIAALEDTVNVLEKKLHNLKKIEEQKGKKVR